MILEGRGKCPCCGKGEWSYNEKEMRYGAVVRCCAKCGCSYYDRRYHELALEGIPAQALSIAQSAKRALISAILLLFFGGWTLAWRMGKVNSISLWVPFFTLCWMFALGYYLFDMVRIRSGAKMKSFERLRAESQQRLQNPIYVEQLRELGYHVPE